MKVSVSDGSKSQGLGNCSLLLVFITRHVMSTLPFPVNIFDQM